MKIAFVDQHETYRESLVPTILAALSETAFEVTTPRKAELVIVGPFHKRKRGIRKAIGKLSGAAKSSSTGALRLYHTGENTRHDSVSADYAISFDLAVKSESHFRLPLWMESIDWSHERVSNVRNSRVNELLRIEDLMIPLGKKLLARPRRAALITSHMLEPRSSLFQAVAEVMPIVGYGKPFNPAITHHDSSGFAKEDLLKDFLVNLCPENSLYPGYYTEKIIESYGSGCLPVTWTDPNVGVDFNPRSFVNALEFAATGYEAGLRDALTPQAIAEMSTEPLLLSRPSIEPLVEFLRKVISDAK